MEKESMGNMMDLSNFAHYYMRDTQKTSVLGILGKEKKSRLVLS